MIDMGMYEATFPKGLSRNIDIYIYVHIYIFISTDTYVFM